MHRSGKLLAILFFYLIRLAVAQPDRIMLRVDSLLAQMNLEEKIGQMNLRGTSSRSKGLSEELKQQVRSGEVGAVLNLTNPELVLELQRIATTESRRKIPLLFGRDVIHGYKTIFPIPLALASSWDLHLIQQTSEVAAKEAYSKCINWTFAPMVDICRDARWGRIAESPGEDPYLASQISKAYIRGFQGKNLSTPGSILACAKHFAAYGAAEGGRDYNTVSVSPALLHDVYLPPFQAAANAHAATFMTAFNDVNGVPASCNAWLLQDMLRKRWGYKGFVVSDWNSVTEMIAHGYCEDERDAAMKAVSAGMEMEMTSNAFAMHLKNLVTSGKISETQINEAVRHILYIKFKAGLFENPNFKDREKFSLLDEGSLEMAKSAAVRSSVLLKNDTRLLPLAMKTRIAMIGPMANAPKEQLGTWIFDGDKKDSQTPYVFFSSKLSSNKLQYASGLSYSRDKSESGFQDALNAAANSDVIVFVGGEEAILSGEAHSRADISLPGAQEKLLVELSKTGKPVVLVLMSGRPIGLERILPKLSAVLVMWHGGTMSGPALYELLYGIQYPSGKLPVTWPKHSGQIPIYYNHPNTGRPANPKNFVGIDSIPMEAWQSSLGNNSHYLDAGYTPQFPFGFGLSYTQFQFQDLRMKDETLTLQDTIEVEITVKNTGDRHGKETVQVYFQDLHASLVQPVKRLIRFEQVPLSAGASQTLQFRIPVQEMGFHDQEGRYWVEPGWFKVWVGPDSERAESKKIRVD